MALTEKCPFFGLFGSLELDWAAGAKETRGATGEYLYCENRKRGDEVILAVDTNTIHEKMKNSRHRHRRHSIGPRQNSRRRLLLERLEDRRLLTLYTVTSLDDGIVDGDGKLTLREALEGASTNAAAGDAIAGNDDSTDEIRFAPEAFNGGLNTLFISSTLIAKGEVGDPLKIIGPGHDKLVISGEDIDTEVFRIFGDVTIAGLSITSARRSAIGNGVARDVLTNEEFDVVADVKLKDVHFVNNHGVDGGAINLSRGSLIVDGGLFDSNSATGDGGAIYLEKGTLSAVTGVVRDARFVNNSASDGGAIANENTNLTILRSEFIGNNARSDGGAISSDTVAGSSSTSLFESTLEMNSSSSRGGSVFAVGSGEVIIGESKLVGNTAGTLGGGVAFLGDVDATVRSSWLTENTSSRGGGIYAESQSLLVDASTLSSNISRQNGGGLAVTGADLTMINTTLSQNQASGFGGGLWQDSGSYTLVHNTIVRNRANADGDDLGDGGGISIAADRSLAPLDRFRANLVAGNKTGGESESASSDIQLHSGGSVSRNSIGNLIGDPNSAGGMGREAGDEFGNEIPLDSIIFRELSDNLGGLVPVHALKIDSPAIDKAFGTPNIPIDSDARGYPFSRQDRQFQGLFPADSGAFEVQLRPLTTTSEIVVSTTRDESDGDFSFGDLSLREAVELANRRTDRSAIRFDRALLPTNGIPTTFKLDSGLGPLHVMWDLALTGPGSSLIHLSGNDETGILEIGSLATVDISGVRFVRGRADQGGAIANRGTTSLSDVSFVLNTSVGTLNSAFQTHGGGAIVNHVGGTLTIRDSVLERNSAAVNGGAILNLGTMTIGPSVDVIRNDAGTEGGGVYNFRAELNIVDSRIQSNSADQGGGVGSGRNGKVEIRRSRIVGNTASSGGGGGIAVFSSLAMFDTTVASNKATPPRFFNNGQETAGAAGGGVFVQPQGGEITIDRSTISDNDANANGVLVTDVSLELSPMITTAENHGLNDGDDVSLEDFTFVSIEWTATHLWLASRNRRPSGQPQISPSWVRFFTSIRNCVGWIFRSADTSCQRSFRRAWGRYRDFPRVEQS